MVTLIGILGVICLLGGTITGIIFIFLDAFLDTDRFYDTPALFGAIAVVGLVILLLLGAGLGVLEG